MIVKPTFCRWFRRTLKGNVPKTFNTCKIIII